jgi:hypothetical protein
MTSTSCPGDDVELVGIVVLDAEYPVGEPI